MAFAALTTFAVGLAVAQTPAPQPAPAQPPASDSLPVPPPPAITGTAWVLMDAASGNILAGENYDQRVEPASITKVMTSYVIAAEMAGGKVKDDDQVMMSENAWRAGGAGTDGSYSGFEVNKTAPLLEMEKGMVVQSGNDAAIALAEHVAGSDGRVRRADEPVRRAHRHEELALRQSARPVGAKHYSTAHDLALLGRALIARFPGRVLVQQDQGIHGRPDHRSPTATCCCGAIRRSTASRPATTPAPATA